MSSCTEVIICGKLGFDMSGFSLSWMEGSVGLIFDHHLSALFKSKEIRACIIRQLHCMAWFKEQLADSSF